MPSTINLSFRYLQSDFSRAMRAHYASRLRLRLDIPLVILLALAGIYYWRSADSQWIGMTLVGVAAAFGLLLVAAFTVIPLLVFRGEAKFRDEYSLTFSTEGIHFRTAHIDSELQWSMYSRALVDAHSYILYYGSRSFTVIPKRFFQNAEQQEAFDQLLTNNVPQITRKGR